MLCNEQKLRQSKYSEELGAEVCFLVWLALLIVRNPNTDLLAILEGTRAHHHAIFSKPFPIPMQLIRLHLS